MLDYTGYKGNEKYGMRLFFMLKRFYCIVVDFLFPVSMDFCFLITQCRNAEL